VESRQRTLVKLFNVQVLEQFARDAIAVAFAHSFVLLEFEKELAAAQRVRLTIARVYYVGFLQIFLARTAEQQAIARRVVLRKEGRTRLLLLELYEQLQRTFMEETILAWVVPIMRALAAKAIKDGKVLLRKEQQLYANALLGGRQKSVAWSP
jgi:hypothetical protein